MKSICEHCGEEYEHYPSRKQRFCSQDCYLEWNRGRNHPQWKESVTLTYDGDGYPVWHDNREGEDLYVKVHRLLAVAEFGFDAVADAEVVHHTTEFKQDNRPGAIELLGRGEHTAMHNRGEVRP